MTSITTGTQWLTKPLNQSDAHVFKQPIRPPLRHSSTSGTGSGRVDVEPASKRQKVNHEHASPAPSRASHVQDSSFGSPLSSPQANTSTQTHPNCPNIASAPPLVFPLRQSSVQRQVPSRLRSFATHQTTTAPEGAQIKPFVLAIPPAAPRYAGDSKAAKGNDVEVLNSAQPRVGEYAADFSPWRGNHAEDVLNEASIRNGFFDKVHVSQTESSTARQTIWSSLRHKAGLQVLSSVFVSILDRRQLHGTVTAGCTFKPPPRVTVTGHKREAWLQDLANLNISLRRLSRSIPHGIRGRVLLDQSLAKNIPVARSLWLAKCVGANEIRSFKRKGAGGAFAVGGESKWIRDWTADVEQFIDSIIATCGSADWKQKMAYGFRLASHLLAENLLDEDHYFDWLLNAVRQSDLERLPMYLIAAKSYLTQLGEFRRYGRRLLESLLHQIHKIDLHSSPGLYKPLRNELGDLVRHFVMLSPESFLLPKHWQRHGALLKEFVGGSSSIELQRHFEILSRRNIRLETLAGSGPKSEVTAGEMVDHIFDSLSSDNKVVVHASDMWETMPDPNGLVRMCLQWASSIYRHGQARTYLAIRLLREWSAMGLDVEAAILDFLAVESNTDLSERAAVYTIIAEMIRSRHFSVGKCLQWMIANGILSRYRASATVGDFQELTIRTVNPRKLTCALGLIFEMPMSGLPIHILNLRQNLLRSVGVTIEDESQTIRQIKASIDAKLHCGDDQSLDLSSSRFAETLATRFEISRWICQKLKRSPSGLQHEREEQQPSALIPDSTRVAYCSLDLQQFGILIGVLEDVEDFGTMSNVLASCSQSKIPQIFSAAAIIASHYSDVFIALGVADALFVRMYRQCTNDEDESFFRSAGEVLIDLGHMLANRSSEVQRLKAELQKFEARSGVAACSPISESMAEALQFEKPDATSTSTDDIEQLLASGTSMDEPLIRSVFGLIWNGFEASWTDSIQSSFASARLIDRLRRFNPALVEEMMALRMDQMRTSASRPKLSRIWIPLVCAQVTSLKHLFGQSCDFLRQPDSRAAYSRLSREVLEMVSLPQDGVASSLGYFRYRFHAQQQELKHELPANLITLLKHVLEHVQAAEKELKSASGGILQESGIMTLLRSIASSSKHGRETMSEILSPIITARSGTQFIESLLFPAAIGQEGSPSLGPLASVLKHASFLNLPLCRLYLRALPGGTDQEREEAASHILSVATSVLPLSCVTSVCLWASMIGDLPRALKDSIREKTEAKVFTLLAPTSEHLNPDSSKLLECLLSFASAANACSPTTASATRIILQMYELLTRLVVSQGPTEGSLKTETTLPVVDVSQEGLDYEKLDAALQLLHIHQASMYAPNVPEPTITRILVLLSHLALHTFPMTHKHIAPDTFDLLTILSDSISPAIQTNCIRILHDQYHLQDSRLHYIFGHHASNLDDAWLQLATGGEGTEKPTLQAFPIRRWETMPDATPLMTENDTSISLTLFGARKKVL